LGGEPAALGLAIQEETTRSRRRQPVRIRRHLSYANVAATLALAGVLGGGAAYAGGLVDSRDIQNNSIRSRDLRNHKAVRAGDVRRNALTGKQIREPTLDASQFSAMGGSQELGCNPIDGSFVDCASVTIDLPRRGRVFVVATGANYSEGAPANGNCEVRVNGADASLGQIPGEETTDNTSAVATDGFARTLVTRREPAGPVHLTLACNQAGSEDFRVAAPTIAAFGLGQG
jgi:hypothetical protein